MSPKVGDTIIIGGAEFNVTHEDTSSNRVRIQSPSGTDRFWISVPILVLMGCSIKTDNGQQNLSITGAGSSYNWTFQAPTPTYAPVCPQQISFDTAKMSSDKQLEPKCECGSAALGSNKHSDYCPLYKLQEA